MELRPHIKKAIVNADSSPEETFQNTVVRQIIKMKHDLLILHTRQNIHKKQKDFNTLSRENQQKFLNASFDKDQAFKSELRGIIIGHFSVDEYQIYSKMPNVINRRILNIIKERMIDHLEVLND